jgi:hypothetical protein
MRQNHWRDIGQWIGAQQFDASLFFLVFFGCGRRRPRVEHAQAFSQRARIICFVGSLFGAVYFLKGDYQSMF